MPGKIRIIHVEDLQSDADLVERQLKKSDLDFEILLVTNRADFEKVLDTFDADIILSDHSLPSFSSIEALKITRERKRKIPFILITATVSEEFAVSMMKEGIDDYILKDRLQRLPTAIINAIQKLKAEAQREQHLLEIISREKKFSALIEKNYDAIVLCDEHLNVTYRSPSVYRMTGYEQNELNAKADLMRINPNDVELLQHTVNKSLQEPGQSQQIKLRMQHKSGSYIWLEGTITNLLNNPDVNALVMNFRDVTENIKSEEALLKTGQHFRALIENISDAIILVNTHGTIVYNSPSVKRVTGFELTETNNKLVFDFFHPADIAASHDILKTAKQKPGVPIYSSLRIRHKNGHYIWVEGTINNLLDDESVGAIIISYRDITERKSAEELLLKSEATLRSIVNNAQLAYVLLNKEFNVMAFNEIASRAYLKEFKRELVPGTYIFDYLPEDRKARTKESYQNVLKGNKLKYEANFIQANGNLNWYGVNAFPVFDENKQTLGLIIATEDITDRKNAEIEKEKMTEDLIKHNKNLEQFAYIISHNLRSPVANILGLIYVLKNSPQMDKADLERVMDGLGISVKKLDDVIIDLNFILQKRREISEKKELINLKTLVQDIETLLGEDVEKQNGTISTNFTEVNELFSIKSYLNSIFLNLITNSIKYKKPDTAVSISISTQKKNNKVFVSFTDNGLGIDLDAYGDKLFGLYKKFHHHVEGKGMGLYMVRTQVELLGGKINVNSVVNQGTTFVLEFDDV